MKKSLFRSPSLIVLLFLLPNLLGFLIFTVFPIIASLVLSFFNCDLLQTKNILSWEFIGLGNFTRLMHDSDFFRYLWNTLFLMIKIPITMAISLLLAVLLNQKLKGKLFFKITFFLPTICAGTAIYMLWRWIYNADFGLLNYLITKISFGNIVGPKWLSDFSWAKPSFILMNTWMEMGGMNMILYLAALQTIPQEYYEASSLDGAKFISQFINITWPMLGPTTFFIFTMNLINGFQEGFQQAHIMTQGGPAGSTMTLSYYIYNQAYVWNHMGYASAISWVLFLIVSVITLINWKFGSKKVFYG